MSLLWEEQATAARAKYSSKIASDAASDVTSKDAPDLFPMLAPSLHSNPKSRGKCCKGFPFPYCEETQVETNGYPQYKRPEGGPKFTAIKRNDKFYNDIDSRWIVPYNPYLLRKYKCHFNVQTACSIKSVKYIYKYIYSKYFICYTCICILSKKL